MKKKLQKELKNLYKAIEKEKGVQSQQLWYMVGEIKRQIGIEEKRIG